VLKSGWREVDPPGKTANAERADAKADAETEEGSEELPRVAKDETAETLKAEAIEKWTKAPPRYSEASLLGAMETAGKRIEDEELRLAMRDAGLGTSATRAAVIETLLKRDYISRDKKSVTATAKGIALIEMLPSTLLKSAELTGAWEQKLVRMSRDDYALEVFMDEVKSLAAELVKEIGTATIAKPEGTHAREQSARPDDALDCPKCKHEGRAGFLIERTSTAGKFLVCSQGREACGFLSDAPKNSRQRKAMSQTSCPACGAAMRVRQPKEKGKRAFLSCVKYPDCAGRRWFDEKGNLEEPSTLPPETGPKCLKCETPTVKRGPTSAGSFFWSCPRWRSDGSGCDAKPMWINEK
jgi:ssDNA-binding Zn-finger/Zn-ribbon topoisomerase 1